MKRALPLALAILTLGTPARGDEDVEAAKAHYATGSHYFDRGEFKLALAEFQAAERGSTRPELDYNIARCHEEMGDAARAIARYQRYLAARPDAADRDALREAIARLSRRVGRLSVVSRVPGAQVRLDGEPLAAADLQRPFDLTEGPHMLRATADGWLSREVTVQVVAGQLATAAVDPLPAATPLPTRRVGLWIGLSGAAAAIVAAIVVIALAAQPSADYWNHAAETCAPPCVLKDLR